MLTAVLLTAGFIRHERVLNDVSALWHYGRHADLHEALISCLIMSWSLVHWTVQSVYQGIGHALLFRCIVG